MLKAEPDLSVKAITSGQGQWFVHAQHNEKPPEGREFVMFKSYDAFSKAINDRIKVQHRKSSIFLRFSSKQNLDIFQANSFCSSPKVH